MDGIALEPHRPDDRRFAREMLEAGASATYPDLGRLGRVSRRERLDALFEAHWERADKLVWIARAGDRPAGMVWLEPSHHGVTELPELVVVNLAVADGFRGQGLGRLLAERAVAEARARGYERVRLFVAADNAAAQALYRAVGFAPRTVEMQLEVSGSPSGPP